MRLASLLPSATEIVDVLGLADQLVGVSHSCDFPASVIPLPKLTRCRIDVDAPAVVIDAAVKADAASIESIYVLETPKLKELKPDLIISQGVCDVCAVSGRTVSEVLTELNPRPALVNLEPFSLADVLATITAVGGAAGVEAKAEEVVSAFQARIDAVREATAKASARPRLMFVDWTDPPFLSGHWTHDLIEYAGATNIMSNIGAPSVETTWEHIIEQAPDVLMVACCGFPLERTLREINGTRAETAIEELRVKGTIVHTLDGKSLFSNPGPRIIDSLELLAHTLHPDLVPLPNIRLK